MSEPFVQKNGGDRLKVINGRLYKLTPLKGDDFFCHKDCAFLKDIGTKMQCNNERLFELCAKIQSYAVDITDTLPKQIREKYGKN